MVYTNAGWDVRLTSLYKKPTSSLNRKTNCIRQAIKEPIFLWLIKWLIQSVGVVAAIKFVWQNKPNPAMLEPGRVRRLRRGLRVKPLYGRC